MGHAPHYRLTLVIMCRENFEAPSLLLTGDRDPFIGPSRAPGPLGIPTFKNNPIHVRKLESGPAGTDDGRAYLGMCLRFMSGFQRKKICACPVFGIKKRKKGHARFSEGGKKREKEHVLM